MVITKKNMILAIVFAVLAFSFALYLTLTEKRGIEEITTDGKDITKEEYIYKEDLLSIGYSVDEISAIEKKLSNTVVKQYLLSKKYDNLISFINSKYFNAENIERYENYYSKNKDYNFDDIVLYVEIGLDKEFYTEINVLTEYKSITTLVNKYNQLPKEATFDDLVNIPKPYSNNDKLKFRNIAYPELIQMIDDAKLEGLTLQVGSAFRTWNDQNSLFNNNKKKNGLEHALLYQAKPGHSEHQLGLAVDFSPISSNFAKKKEYAWLKENAHKYGFIERYPNGKEFITGYNYEPWHYRYIGKDIAKIIHDENITYEEYLIIHK
jgi:D-alanyl-D-alanine carboxypeptidase